MVRYDYETLDFGRTIRIPCKTCLRIEVEEDLQGGSVDKQNRIYLIRSNPLMNQQDGMIGHGSDGMITMV